MSTMMRRYIRMSLAALLFGAWTASATMADEPLAEPEALHQQIDRLVRQGHPGTPAGPASDAEFLRRIYLDLVGRAPLAEQVEAFLSETAPDKRSRVVDQLLSSSEFSRHMAEVLDVMFMERRADKHIKSDDWQTFLRSRIEAGQPLNELARDILAADGVDEANRPAVKFYLDRDGETNLLTRDVGRVFFGMDLQCAQCHDHPLIGDYYQSDYYGLYAFLNRSFVFTDAKAQKSYFAEKADGDVQFTSVFTEESGRTGPQLPGELPLDEPPLSPAEEYQVRPDKEVRPVPAYSRRAQLAAHATDGSNSAFNRNLANRLWAHMMGRGLVEPVDVHSVDNPPTHPELLNVLSAQLVAMQFDLRRFLRELALSQTYQRSMDMPANLAEQAAEVTRQLAEWQTQLQQLSEAVQQAAARRDELQGRRDELAKQRKPLVEQLVTAGQALREAQVKQLQADDELRQAQAAWELKRKLAESLGLAAASARQAAAQLADDAEVLQAAELFDSRRQAVDTELAPLAQAVEQKQAAATAAASAVPPLVAQRDQVAAQLAPLEQPWQALAAELLEVTRALDAAKIQLASVSQRSQSAESLLAYQEAVSQGESVRQQWATLNQQQAALTESLATKQQQLTGLEQQMAASEAGVAEAAQQVTSQEQQVAALKPRVDSLVDAAAKAATVQGQLPADEAVKAAASKLAERRDAVQASYAAAQAQLAELVTKADALRAQHATLATQLEQHRAQLATEQASLDGLPARIEQAGQQMAGAEEQVGARYDDLVARWTRSYGVAPLKPLSPEQIAWSMMWLSGQVERQKAAVRAELNSKSPLGEADQQDPAKLAAREQQVLDTARQQLAGNVNQFVSLFGAGSGQPQTDFFATVDQALFLANGGTLRAWLAPTPGSLTHTVVAADEPEKAARALYLGVLNRPPTEAEISEVGAYLAGRSDQKAAAVQELAWSLFASAEFRFNH